MTVTTISGGNFKVQRDGRAEHVVTVTDSGASCDCPGFRYRNTCCHVDAIPGSPAPQPRERRDTPAPVAMFNAGQIPQELRDRVAWVGWRGSKVPLDVKAVRNASCRDRSTWSSFEQALEWAQQCDCGGLGYEFSDDDPYTGIDLDGCRDPLTGEIEGWACAIIARMNSYSEISPSGRGVHVFVKAAKPGPKCRAASGVEMYGSGRYFCVTGAALPGSPRTIESRQTELDDLYAETFEAAQD